MGSFSLTGWALFTLPALAQLPPPPVSVAPVVKLEYDAHGNPTRTVIGPDAPGLNLSTSHSYDRLHRKQQTTDARLGVTRLDYNGREDIAQVTDPRNLVTQYPRNGLGDTTGLSSPDTGAATLTRDAAGNVITRLDSRGVLATSTFDALNRLTSTAFTKAGQAAQVFTWVYDQTGPGFSNGIGRLTSTGHPSGSTRHAYDAQGRLTSSTQIAAYGKNLTTHTAGYAYDSGGNVEAITYPSGRVLTIAHVGGLPSSLTLAPNAAAAGQPLVSQLSFEPFGAVRSWQWHLDGGLQLHERLFDTSGRMIRYPLASVVRDVAFDAADRINSYQHRDRNSGTQTAGALALDQTFGYDELGRVTNVVSGTGVSAQIWAYSYDANGNRTLKSFSNNGGGSFVNRDHVLANNSNRLLAMNNSARSFSYDTAGNTVAALSLIPGAQTDGWVANWVASWNLSGRMDSLRGTVDNARFITTGYVYDAFGHRVLKEPLTLETCSPRRACSALAYAPGQGTVFVYGALGELLGEYNSGTGAALREYIWLQGMPVAVVVNDATNPAPSQTQTYFIHADHLNTPRVVVNKSNVMRWSWMAEPFGSNGESNDPQGLGAFSFNLRMPGQYFDAESGLSYNYFRDYDAGIGRYTQSDPIGLAGGINTYAYVEGNPVSKVDPLGLETYLCQRPLDGFHGVSAGPLYHQFLCTLDAKGKVNCGGLGPRDGSSGMFGGPGVIEPESSVRPEQCEKVRDLDQCFEKCVNDSLASRAPNYDVRAGRSWLFPSSNTQQCQVYAKSVLDRCSAQCRK